MNERKKTLTLVNHAPLTRGLNEGPAGLVPALTKQAKP